jgi:hypothetical protein
MIMFLPNARPNRVNRSTRPTSTLVRHIWGICRTMTTYEALALGIMLVWTPSLIVLSCFLCRAPLIEKEDERVPAREASVQSKQNTRPTPSCEKKVEVNLYVECTTSNHEVARKIFPVQAGDRAGPEPESRQPLR